MWVGVHVDGVPFGGLDPLIQLERAVGPMEVVHWFQAWGSGHRAIRADWLDAVAASSRAGLLTWEPWALPGSEAPSGSDQPRFTLQSVVDGRHDDYVRGWAEVFASREDGPWFLRPMHEMNGDWYPWGDHPGSAPDLFRTAWRHIHGIFSNVGVTSVSWVWCPLADAVGRPLRHYYPGDGYVDVLALDGYNWGSSTPEYGGWRSAHAIFADGYQQLTELGPQPIWFAEVGCAPDGGDKAQWTADLLAADGFDRLEAVVFFALDKERDWRIDADPAVAAAIRDRHEDDSPFRLAPGRGKT